MVTIRENMDKSRNRVKHRLIITYTLVLLLSPIFLMAFIPGTLEFTYALAVYFLINLFAGIIVSHLMYLKIRERSAMLWEMKMVYIPLVTATASLIGLCAVFVWLSGALT